MADKGRVTTPQAMVTYVQPFYFKIQERHDGAFDVQRFELPTPVRGKLEATTVPAAKRLARSIADAGGRARVLEWSGPQQRWVERAKYA